MSLQWRAVCPACKYPITRKGMLSETIKCPGCGTVLQQNQRWNQIAYAIVGVMGVLFLIAAVLANRAHLVSKPTCVGAMVAFLCVVIVAAIWGWPYITKYDLHIQQPPEAQPPSGSADGHEGNEPHA
jgi:cytochrome bd-type quinol oxidase subunit 2